MSDPSRVSPRQRQQWILDKLDQQEYVSVKDLADEFGLTEMSLRRDLNVLAERGQLARVRGGAARPRVPTTGPARRYFTERSGSSEAKGRIASATAGLIGDDVSTVFFYSGSTVAKVAEAVGLSERSQLTVVTPSLPVIHTVSDWPDPHLVAIGGLYLPTYLTFVGPQAVDSLKGLSADLAIVGCDGLSATEGLTTPHQLVAEIGTVLIERARKTIVVADSSKVGRHGFTSISPAYAVDVLVTDEGADPKELERLRDTGVEVVLV